ncbi:hypothetical protein [uncultured Treponema sp.]|uniref:hypothetical protein n=1 Tax=uncultured Treponema sp. TaxID=162155 RepID=UPI0025EFF962|nr:hypothetical protein [uncultured Treponema sp.]
MPFLIQKRFISISLLCTIFTAILPAETDLNAEPENSMNQTESAIETSAETKTQIIFNPIIFVRDLLDDKLPLRVDFGAEPHRHGSMVFGAAYYDWSENLSQSFRGEYDHYITSTNSNTELKNTEVRSIVLMPNPVVFFIGDSDIRSKSIFSQFNIGLYFQYSHTTTNSGVFFSSESNPSLKNSGFALTDMHQTYRLIGPSFGYSLSIPIHKYISFTAEGFMVPAFLVTLYTDSDTTYHYGDENSSDSSSLSFRSLSYPYLKQSIAFNFFRYIRIKGQMTYQHFDLRAIVSEEDNNSSYSLHTITLRYGGELLHPSKNRKKSAHLWAGLYYEMTWNKMYLSNSASTEYTGKWILCFGT